MESLSPVPPTLPRSEGVADEAIHGDVGDRDRVPWILSR